jgi:hypothetical protein
MKPGGCFFTLTLHNFSMIRGKPILFSREPACSEGALPLNAQVVSMHHPIDNRDGKRGGQYCLPNFVNG